MSTDRPLLECVPNFSEGRDEATIEEIVDAIEAVDAIQLLGVDPGHATHRTVVTFVGPPEAVVEAAFRGIQTAARVIDMRDHEGEHPRMGATDVCPLVPVAGIDLDEAAEWARKLARRVGEELSIPVYLYEHAASRPERRNLSTIRKGEYEGLPEKLADPAWTPDFGPAAFNPTAGATVIGARSFLVAYNINLNTTSTRRANAVAFDLRERGRVQREGGRLTGAVLRDDEGNALREPGMLESVKGIGWFIEEYGIAQVSLNLTDLETTSIHEAFEAACESASVRGLRVTGSELVGLVPLSAMLAAGRHFLRLQERSLGLPDEEIVRIAVRSLGLDELGAFDPNERIIEWRLRNPSDRRLVNLSTRDLVHEAASESSAPGGGSTGALVGALGAAMGTMVANLSAHKRGWDDRWEEFSEHAQRGMRHVERMLDLVDEDTRAFEGLMAAYRMPKGTDGERAARKRAIQAATREATESPLELMREAFASMDVAAEMADHGLGSSISDAAVGAICARAAVRAGWLNVEINVPGLDDRAYAESVLGEGRRLVREAEEREADILERVRRRMDDDG